MLKQELLMSSLFSLYSCYNRSLLVTILTINRVSHFFKKKKRTWQGSRLTFPLAALVWPTYWPLTLQVCAWRRVDAAAGHPRGVRPQIPVGGLPLQQSATLLPGHRHPEHRKSQLERLAANSSLVICNFTVYKHINDVFVWLRWNYHRVYCSCMGRMSRADLVFLVFCYNVDWFIYCCCTFPVQMSQFAS